MPYVRKLIQRRVNTSDDFFTPGQEAISVIESYKSQGKILDYTNINENDTLNIIGIIFNTQLDLEQFSNEVDIVASRKERTDHCIKFNISWESDEYIE